jgi:CheY-like chemotaxis protein
MRNPLSAILQCADEISSSLSEFRSTSNPSSVISSQLVESNIDAAQIIALCAQHQKRIVDDVLTLSKLDSALLLVTPIDVQPVLVVQRALKMFEGEMETNSIELNFVIDKSYEELNIDWVRLDPSRLLQVLINLTTNAIKFTTTEELRTIIVSVGASLEPPTKDSARGAVSYFPQRSHLKDATNTPEWGTGEQVFIQFTVKDTGRGLTEEEKKLLFLRFSQASPRTHVQYGGSGLGLFISRELTELQGGEIGVASESGKGSTFAFYVKARRSTAPENLLEIPSTLGRKSSTGKKESKATAESKTIPLNLFSTSKPATNAKNAKKDLSMYNVLIVEDNLVNQRVLQKQLKNLGCGVQVANHGREALDYLKTTSFWKGKETKRAELSVILMDLEMPIMDGLTATREIRKLENEGNIVRHVPIIAVTANARGEQISTARKAGMVCRHLASCSSTQRPLANCSIRTMSFRSLSAFRS